MKTLVNSQNKLRVEVESINEEMSKQIDQGEWIEVDDTSIIDTVDPKYWDTSGDSVSEMTQEEKNAVDNATLSPYRIYNFMDQSYGESVYKAPRDFDYRLLNLWKEETRDHGYMKSETYYSEYDSESDQYLFPVVKEDVSLVYESGVLRKEIKNIVWIREDGTEGESKSKGKKRYSRRNGMMKMEDARHIHINELKDVILKSIELSGMFLSIEEIMEEAERFDTSYGYEIQSYIRSKNRAIIQKFNEDVDFLWLDNVITDSEEWWNKPVEDGTTYKELLIQELSYTPE